MKSRGGLFQTTDIALYSQFYSFVPVDDVAGQHKRLDVDDVHVTVCCPHVEPLALERQAAICDPEAKHHHKFKSENNEWCFKPQFCT